MKRISEKRIERQLSFARMSVTVCRLGEDCHLLIQGGDRSHIGCTVLAVPRPSLSGDGTMSCTASVINVTGHKDEYLCRYLAEKTAAGLGVVTVCTGGFHTDHITEAQLKEVMAAVKELGEEIVMILKGDHDGE